MSKFFVFNIIIFAFFFVQAKVKIEVQYSYSANFFDLMDNVSNWWEGFTEAEYQTEWQKKISSLTEKDKKYFDQYRNLRQNYYNDPDQKEKDPLINRNGFFSRVGAVTADPVAEVFYDSQTMEESLRNLSKLLKPEEVEFLRGFYSHFEKRAALFLKESEAFKKILPSLRKSLSGSQVEKYFSDVAAFYEVQPQLVYKVLFVWFPPIKRSTASPTGKYLIMRYNPVEDLEMAKSDSDIAFHEVVHAISSQQPLEQKQKITQEFLKICPVKDRLKPLTILEEPLAVVFGQAIYLEKFNPQKLDLSKSLYNNPWISTYAKLLLPLLKVEVKTKKTINSGVIQKAASICKELVLASEKIEIPSTTK